MKWEILKKLNLNKEDIMKYAMNSSVTKDSNAWQKNSTPDSICDKMINLYKEDYTSQSRILILFNLEFIKSIYINYSNVNFKNIYFIADSEKKLQYIKEFFPDINVTLLENHNLNNLIECIKGFNVKQFDVIFSNPPYNDGLDLKILSSVKNLFVKAIIVHPAVWILSNKENGKFEKFKKEFQNNIEKVVIFRGSDIFGVPFMSALDICIFNNEKLDSKIEVDDQVVNCKYIANNHIDITQYGDMWFKIGIKNFIEKCKSYKSILDMPIRQRHFNNESYLKFPCKLPVLRSGNPHFNDGYYDEKLGYYVLNKTNYFFTCIAKGDPEKYHFVTIEKNSTLCYNFESAEERLNFYNYCKTKIFRFILSFSKISANIDRGELKNTPWLDFTKKWNDAKLCKEFGISEELWEYIDNFIPDYYPDYESGF